MGVQECGLLWLRQPRGRRTRYAVAAAVTDVGLVMIIAWILGAVQGVLLGELIRDLLHYVKLRSLEERVLRQIMSSRGPRAPWV